MQYITSPAPPPHPHALPLLLPLASSFILTLHRHLSLRPLGHGCRRTTLAAGSFGENGTGGDDSLGVEISVGLQG